MEVLGQLVGLSGHISPLAAFCKARDMVLLMDVWWETRPCWVRLEDLWAAMDTLDSASNQKVGLGRWAVLCCALQSLIFREGLFW